MSFYGEDLNLNGKEPSADEVLPEIKKQWDREPFYEIVFCGYGEPTMRLKELVEIGETIKSGKLGADLSKIKIRLNTIGLANAVHGRDTVNDIAKAVDAVVVSINTADEKQWLDIVRPAPKYAENGFETVKEFTRLCAKKINDVSISAVESEELNTEKFKSLARELGAKAVIRPFL